MTFNERKTIFLFILQCGTEHALQIRLKPAKHCMRPILEGGGIGVYFINQNRALKGVNRVSG